LVFSSRDILAPYVFIRPGELRHAKCSAIDLDSATWKIPAEKNEDETDPYCLFGNLGS
jgi:hypothetical protein